MNFINQTIANFDDLAVLVGINNLENQINFQPHQPNNRKIYTDAFEISDSAFTKNYKLNKNVAKL